MHVHTHVISLMRYFFLYMRALLASYFLTFLLNSHAHVHVHTLIHSYTHTSHYTVSAPSITAALMAGLNPHGAVPPIYQSSLWAVIPRQPNNEEAQAQVVFVECYSLCLTLSFSSSFLLSILMAFPSKCSVITHTLPLYFSPCVCLPFLSFLLHFLFFSCGR